MIAGQTYRPVRIGWDWLDRQIEKVPIVREAADLVRTVASDLRVWQWPSRIVGWVEDNADQIKAIGQMYAGLVIAVGSTVTGQPWGAVAGIAASVRGIAQYSGSEKLEEIAGYASEVTAVAQSTNFDFDAAADAAIDMGKIADAASSINVSLDDLGALAVVTDIEATLAHAGDLETAREAGDAARNFAAGLGIDIDAPQVRNAIETLRAEASHIVHPVKLIGPRAGHGGYMPGMDFSQWSPRRAAEAIQDMARRAWRDDERIGTPAEPVPAIAQLQQALGVPPTGYYDSATQRAAASALGVRLTHDEMPPPVQGPVETAHELLGMMRTAEQGGHLEDLIYSDPPPSIAEGILRAARWMGVPYQRSGRYTMRIRDAIEDLTGEPAPWAARTVDAEEAARNLAHFIAAVYANQGDVSMLQDPNHPEWDQRFGDALAQAQERLGVEASGIYDDATFRAVRRLTDWAIDIPDPDPRRADPMSAENVARNFGAFVQRLAQTGNLSAMTDVRSPHYAQFAEAIEGAQEALGVPVTGVYDRATQGRLEQLTGAAMPDPGGPGAERVAEAVIDAARRRRLLSDGPGPVTVPALERAAAERRAFRRGEITPESYDMARRRGRVFWETARA